MKKATQLFNPKMANIKSFLVALTLVLSLVPNVLADDAIPDGVREWLTSQDNEAIIAEDGLLKLSNGDEYLLVIPAESKKVEKVEVTSVIRPEDKPDIVLFNNGYYLLRILTLDGGQRSLPLLDEVPTELKAGRFLNNLNLSESIYVPTQWKTLVIENVEENATTPKQLQAALGWLNTNQGLIQVTSGSIYLPCKPISEQGLLPITATQFILACQNNNKLYELEKTATGFVVSKETELKSPISSIAYNAQNKIIYLTHPELVTKTQLVDNSAKTGGWFKLKKHVAPKQVQKITSEISLYSLNTHKLLPSIQTNQTLGWVYYSSFRKQLYALSSNKENILIINTVTPTKQQSIKLELPIEDWTIQNEKTLWVLTQKTENLPAKIIAIDLRWQELYDAKTLDEKASSIISTEQWVYVFYPQSKKLERLNLVNLGTKDSLGSKSTNITKACSDSQLQLSPDEKIAYLNSTSCQNSIAIDLGALREGETVTHAIAGNTNATWLAPYTAPSSKLARVKFQDARLMLQNGKQPPQVKWPSEPHDQTSAQDQQAPLSPGSKL